ncbi:hypothetical protein JW978_03760 [Candidatus Dojkabacteria bacterium]|nr:hypothetical protein [Candidatus Dojkabacteria bacterium]
MIPEISSDLETILQWVGIGAGVILILSTISFLSLRLSSKDLTDQTGWQNFARPFIGLGFFIITVLFVVLIVLVLAGVI